MAEINTTAKYVKFIRGSKAAFEKLTSKKPDTLYFIYGEDESVGSLYLGDRLIANGGATSQDVVNTLAGLLDVKVENVNDGMLLGYSEALGKWIPMDITTLVTTSEMTGATANHAGVAGSVPAPQAGDQEKFLRGDGTWAEIPKGNSQVFEVTTQTDEDHATALNRITTGKNLFTGDIAIVKELIAKGKYQYTAYVYDNSKWKAMDGNYRADNVYFDEDFIFTKAVGTVTIPTSGNTTVSAAGKNLQEFFAGLFAEEENPTTPATSASLSSNNIGAKEVGTKIGVNYSFSTTADAYKFGPSDNGVKWSNYKATFNGETLTGSSGTFTTVQVTDSTSLSITGSVEQSAGAIPLTNLGNEYPAAQIPSKSWNNLSKGTLTGYRAWFCGYKNGDNALADPTAITGDQIRALGNSANGSWKSSMDITKMKQMYFAAPAGKGYKPSVKDAATTAPQTVLGPITVYVKGAENYTTADAPNGIAYDVWYVANADAASGSATVNIGKA